MNTPLNREQQIEFMSAAATRDESRTARWKSDPIINEVLLMHSVESKPIVSYTRVEEILASA